MSQKLESKATRDFGNKATGLVFLFIAIGSILFLAVSSHESSADKSEIQADVDDILSRPLAPGAPGCEIRLPNGGLINKRFDEVDSYQDSKIFIEAGTTVNGDCFPDADTKPVANSAK